MFDFRPLNSVALNPSTAKRSTLKQQKTKTLYLKPNTHFAFRLWPFAFHLIFVFLQSKIKIMKKLALLLVLSASVFFTFAQNKQITLEDIWKNGTFRPDWQIFLYFLYFLFLITFFYIFASRNNIKKWKFQSK